MNDKIQIKYLGEIGDVKMCKRVLKEQTSVDEEIPFFKISTFGEKPDTFISSELFNEYIAKYSYPKKGDILISAAGTVGKTVIFNGEKSYFQDSNIVWIENPENIILNKYLFYFYQTKPWQTTNGSTITRIYNNDLRSIKITFPISLKTQQKIAAVLSALDDKIELNNQLNAQLEQMAKTIYDYWFVQFDFPDENGKPYKSSGGKMVFNEVLKREIPVGWEVKDFGEIFQISRGTLVTKDTSTNGNYKVVAAGINYSYLHGEYNRDKFTITVSGSGANAGFVNFWTEKIFASDCTTVRGKTDGETFLGLQFLKLFQNHIYSQAKGSAQPHVYPSDIQCLKYLKSNTNLEEKAGELLHSYFEKIGNNLKQNQELVQLRDWLLPMLMNGQVRVGSGEYKREEGGLEMVAEGNGEFKKLHL